MGVYITSGAQFDPFSMQEMLTPMNIYADAYNNTMDRLDRLTEDADAVRSLASGLDVDNPVRQAWDRYSSELDTLSGELASGLNKDTVGRVRSLQRGYNGVIKPLAQTRDRLEQWRREQNELLSRDGTVRFDHSVSDPGIVDWMLKNPDAGYKYVSGDEIAKQVGTSLSGLTSQLRSDLLGIAPDAWQKTADGQLIERIERYGLSPEDIEEIRANPDAYPLVSPMVREAVNNAYASSGIDSWGDENLRRYVEDSAWRGVNSAVGKTQVNTREDNSLDREYRSMQISEMRREAELAAKGLPANSIRYDGGYLVPIGNGALAAVDKDGNQKLDREGNSLIIRTGRSASSGGASKLAEAAAEKPMTKTAFDKQVSGKDKTYTYNELKKAGYEPVVAITYSSAGGNEHGYWTYGNKGNFGFKSYAGLKEVLDSNDKVVGYEKPERVGIAEPYQGNKPNTLFGMTRSNLVNTKGRYDFKNDRVSYRFVDDISEIPGMEEFVSSLQMGADGRIPMPYDLTKDSFFETNSPVAQLVSAAIASGISLDELFGSNDYQIMAVKAARNRPRYPDDYVIIKKTNSAQ